jgi:hypothetical protein
LAADGPDADHNCMDGGKFFRWDEVPLADVPIPEWRVI